MDVKISERPPEGWNDFLLALDSGTIYQSTYYADFCKERGVSPKYLRAEENGEILGELLLTFSSRPHDLLERYDSPFLGVTLGLARLVFPTVTGFYGPVCKNESAYELLLSKSKRLSGRAQLSMTPHPLFDNAQAFEKTGFAKKPWGTFLVDLKQYLEVINEARKRSGVRKYPPRAILPFCDCCVRKGVAKTLLAEKDGRVLAGLGISFFNGYINEWGAGHSDYAFENKIYASDLIRWHVIEWGAKNNCRYYDLTGVNPTPETDKEKGIYRFKAKWGGKLTNYCQYV